jgi:hypothetical protein
MILTTYKPDVHPGATAPQGHLAVLAVIRLGVHFAGPAAYGDKSRQVQGYDGEASGSRPNLCS